MGLNRVEVKVPATTANLGPAFDCLGLALDIFNTVLAERSQAFSLSVTGEGESTLPRNRRNRVYLAVETFYRRIGREVPALSIICHNGIPLTRGLGSSAAAVLGGVLAANALEGSPLGKGEVLKLAIELEGHPDNVAPALLGGCQLVVRDGDEWLTAQVPVYPALEFVLFVPGFQMATFKARAVLADPVPRADAVFNLGRAALLLHALASGDRELLRVATQDRLHQPARQVLFPAMPRLFTAALDAGASGVFLSGAGPTVIALARKDQKPGVTQQVMSALLETARGVGLSGNAQTARLWRPGAQIVAEGD
jgi:homoserine kinase